MFSSEASVTKPAPSLSSPRLLHSLGDENKSVLSLTADARHIFVGGQCQDISVWDKQSYTLKTSLRGHTGSILTLELVEHKKWLFSASGRYRIWSTETFAAIHVLLPYLETGAGDLFSLAWNPVLRTIYLGCQNTSIQWFNFGQQAVGRSPQEQTNSGTSTPTRKVHKFFDSYPQYTHKPADLLANNLGYFPLLDANPYSKNLIEIPATNVLDSAHFGYIYCMTMMPSQRTGSDDIALQPGATYHLLTGSGDETVKIWACTSSGPVLKHTFECDHGAVLSIAVTGDTLFAGCQEGYVLVFDLETRTLIRTIIIQENIDILSLSMVHSELYTCSSNGQIQVRVSEAGWVSQYTNFRGFERWSPTFNCSASWSAHEGIVLSSIVTHSSQANGFVLVSGANDGFVKIWDIDSPSKATSVPLSENSLPEAEDHGHDIMTYALSTFVSIPSVSSDPLHLEDCRQAAIWLKKCLHQLGAESTLLPTGEHGSPLVLSTFHGMQGKHPKHRILFYGHYDVISAPRDGWDSDPFTVTGRNGYLYGRGTTDNKGPIMAVACAAAELLRKRALSVDLVFLIEGEEEAGSPGFMDAVSAHKSQIGDIDAILLSNSTWITEYPPCITYGLRGVIHATLEIASGAPDEHSGIEGGATTEPMFDMIRLLATLTDGQRKVAIPGFCVLFKSLTRASPPIHDPTDDSVRPQTEDEKQLYELLSLVAHSPASVLSSRWREPSLTVHKISVSGPGNPTVIPGKVTTKLSLRIVPDQELETVSRSLVSHLNASFEVFRSPNKLSVTIDHTADWWLGDLEDPWSKALETAVREEWGVEPLRIREGGSIPSVPRLEKIFQCHALHLPLGQSSDRAHLPNERISLANLQRGKAVVERFLTRVADACQQPASDAGS
ncbi:glutathione degradosome [Lanmaoa asiatica]|nr:glutathione degradosome [Lanmaoa asiatica]